MRYNSTRGQVNHLSFEEAVMMGLADDGGLLIPEFLPQVQDQLPTWSSYSFQELSFAILSLFIDDEIPHADLKDLINRSYATFSHAEVTPVVSVGPLHILELFHGVTFAFKDVALQFLGNLFEYFLKKRGQQLNVLGATSGDTGSAAIYGLRGKKNVHVFMLHPKGRVSPIQERQMTTVLDANIHNLALEGTFDDAQNIVKSLFREADFKRQYQLGAVNSINWARVLAQIVYYFYAYFRIRPQCDGPVGFSVPTGNFGDILAGYYARKMGLPVNRLIVATNQNDILHRFFSHGAYYKEEVHATWSPSMDIQISSNFERFLYSLSDNNAEQLSGWMETFRTTGKLSIQGVLLEKAKAEMSSGRVSEEDTLATIRKCYEQYGYILDPHTAIGVKAAEAYENDTPIICLATAHPAKFSRAVEQAIGRGPDFPSSLASLEGQNTRCQVLPATADAVRQTIVNTLG